MALRHAVILESTTSDEACTPNSKVPYTGGNLCEGLSGAYSLGLHVASIFIVLGVSILGAMLPMISRYLPWLVQHPFIFVIAKTASTGVLLSVSTIHLLNDSIGSFSGWCVSRKFQEFFPAYAMFFAMVSALAMHGVDHYLEEVGRRWVVHRKEQQALKDEADRQSGEGNSDQRNANELSHAMNSTKRNESFHTSNAPDGLFTKDEPHATGADDNNPQLLDVAADLCPPVSNLDCQHSHNGDSGCAPLFGGCKHHAITVLPEEMGKIRRVISALCMEFGVAVHSIFVGLAVGLTTDDQLRPLLVAIVFHQLFEGMSMGARIVNAEFKLSLELGLAMIFACSAPLGIASATIAVAVSRDSMSGGKFVLMMGILDSICAGILLYLAFNLLFEDFAVDMRNFCGAGTHRRGLRRGLMFGALWGGMLLMALVGKWL